MGTSVWLQTHKHGFAPELRNHVRFRGPHFLEPHAMIYSAPMHKIVYKIAPRTLWQAAVTKGVFEGAPVDVSDGYIHFSTSSQAPETARRHFAGQRDLVLAAIDTGRLGNALKWEVSRGGALFPHLYAPLSMDAVVWVRELPLDDQGAHVFPDMAE